MSQIAPTIGDSLIEQERQAPLRAPRATYRLQFNADFRFYDAQALTPYLHELGISDCYASPIFAPRAGSSHGYDICDHSRINPAIGGEEGFEAFSTTLRAYGMGLILDMVPNHMGIGDEQNTWWVDVLENGPSSIYAAYFDIDWQPVRPELANKVLIPILEDQYGAVLEQGKLRLNYADGTFFISYYEHRFPIAPRTYSSILSYQLAGLAATLGEEHEHVQELQSILTALRYLPPRIPLPPDKQAERNREKEIIKRRIVALEQASPEVRTAIAETIDRYNGNADDPESFDLLDELMEDQAYRLAYWRVAAEEINYRRFFDINELAAIRVEAPEVFQATHHLLLQALAEGKATGLRIDHPDGLWNPPVYFRQLQENYWLYLQARQHKDDQEGDLEIEGAPEQPLYVVAEKILSQDEPLPPDWTIAGTTGYDFLNVVNGLFVERSNRAVFDSIYQQFIDTTIRFRTLVNSTKKMIMLVSLSSEVNELSHRLERIAEKNRRYRDFTLNGLTFAIREVIAGLPVYRTYITGPETVTPSDQRYVEAAVQEAKRRNPRTAESVFDFIRDTLLLRNIDRFPEEDHAALVEFVMKFQQVSGPVIAKGVEDTAFYVYNRLVSLNEVGGHPEHFGTAPTMFHRQNAQRCQHWPHSMVCSSTHDTKRSEDVRARINVLSELPDEWRAALADWSEHNASKKTYIDGDLAPDRNDEYLLYQTLLGVWPTDVKDVEQSNGSWRLPADFAQFRERIASYMHKATKEAKVHTSWVNPNEEYDAAVRNFVLHVLDDTGENPFLEAIEPLLRTVAFYGRFNALSQLLLKLTSPGVPDIYQGNELWDYSLVDPDNRRPVDYQRRRELLGQLKQYIEQSGENLAALAWQLLENSDDGRIKLYITYRTLNYRRDHAHLFAHGDYLPLEASGSKQEHVMAFARTSGSQAIVVAVPRLVVKLTEGTEQPPIGAHVWQDTWLALPHEQAGRRYRNLFTGAILALDEQEGAPGLPLAAICDNFPVALLERIEE